MRKSLLALLAVALPLTLAAKNEIYKTPNDGKVYTLADLAQIAEAGVEKTGELTYRLSKDIEIQENDGFRLENNSVVRMGADVLVRVYGPANMEVADTATVCPDGEGVAPKGFHLYQMDKDARGIRHIRFEGASLSLGNEQGTVVENCTFAASNGKLVKYSVCFSAASVGNVVRGCHFTGTLYSAIGNGSNVAAGMTIEDNLIENCSLEGRNYPYINCVPSGNNGGTFIRRNRIVGAGGFMAGAISVSNMLSMTGANEVVIEDNVMSDCRYGINIYGYQNTRVKGNRIVDCRYENVAANGGSGVTVYSKESLPAKVYLQDNHIEGCLWGVTVVGGSQVNMGRIDVATDSPDYNPGGNVMKNNGNCGTADKGVSAFDPAQPYDLYNNTALTIYAQGNYWGGADLSAEEIEKRIYHVKDNPDLGEVIFLPAGGADCVEITDAGEISVSVGADGSLRVDGVGGMTPVRIYDSAGRLMWRGIASQTAVPGFRGIAVVVVGNAVRRVML